jgi:hypothetical protein
VNAEVDQLLLNLGEQRPRGAADDLLALEAEDPLGRGIHVDIPEIDRPARVFDQLGDE